MNIHTRTTQEATLKHVTGTTRGTSPHLALGVADGYLPDECVEQLERFGIALLPRGFNLAFPEPVIDQAERPHLLRSSTNVIVNANCATLTKKTPNC